MALKFAVNNSLSAITSLPSGISGGALNLISTQTASSSASISFTSGIDSTYDSYVFKFIDIHPQNNNVHLTFNFSTDGGSNYNVSKTSTHFQARHREDDSSTDLSYQTPRDLANGTGYQDVMDDFFNDNDSSAVGTIHLFNPSSTTFVKHFIGNSNFMNSLSQTINTFYAGYCNTTSAINAVDFKMDSGNIDSGIIKMYGVS